MERLGQFIVLCVWIYAMYYLVEDEKQIHAGILFFGGLLVLAMLTGGGAELPR